MFTAGRGDEGETLVEVVISILLLGVAVVAILGAVTFGSVISDDHRSLTTAEIALKSAVEEVKRTDYVSAAGNDAYDAVVASAPDGYVVTVGPVACKPAATTDVTSLASFVACTAATDVGLQVVTVTVASTDGRVSEMAQVVKRTAP